MTLDSVHGSLSLCLLAEKRRQVSRCRSSVFHTAHFYQGHRTYLSGRTEGKRGNCRQRGFLHDEYHTQSSGRSRNSFPLPRCVQVLLRKFNKRHSCSPRQPQDNVSRICYLLSTDTDISLLIQRDDEKAPKNENAWHNFETHPGRMPPKARGNSIGKWWTFGISLWFCFGVCLRQELFRWWSTMREWFHVRCI